MNPFRVAEMTKPYTEYDMIQKHTSLPELAEYRARLLLIFLNKANPDFKQNEIIAVATSLVQLGLDTHDLVPVSNLQKEEKDARSRQLKVLAGDYFSARFYHILAQAGQIEMIKQLSDAICEVNRSKMNLYLKMKQQRMTSAEFLEQTVLIRMQLFLSFNHFFTGELELWADILKMFTLSEMIAIEIERSEQLTDFSTSWSYWHILQTATKDEKKQLQAGEPDKLRQLNLKYSSTANLNEMLDQNRQQLASKIEQMGSEALKQEIKAVYEAFFNYQTV